MQYPETLIPVEDAVRIEQSNLVELFTTPPEVDADDDIHLPWVKDVEGHGLILYINKGKREWVSSALSKTPFSYLQKALNSNVDFDYLYDILVLRGTEGFPLSEVELKYVSSALTEKLRETKVSSRIVSYTTPEIKDAKLREVLDDAVLDILDAFLFCGLDMTVEKPLSSDSVEEVRSGVAEFEGNGLKVTVASKLKDENDREAGVETLSVRVSTAEGEKLVSFSSEF